MSNQAERADRFRALHEGPTFVLPNPWDTGSARILAALGYEALATTSGGFAATLGRLDGQVTRAEALAHAAAIAAATDLPVSADLENGFVDSPADVAETVRLAKETGLAGCSIEDHTGRDDAPIYDFDLAVERIAAAAEAAHEGPVRMVLTARTENYLHGRRDLDDTIARLKAFEEAGADVLFAPGVVDAAEITTILEAVTLPLNVLIFPGVPAIAELAGMGVRRISTGSGLTYVALGAFVEAARSLREGSYRGLGPAKTGAETVHATFRA